MKKSELVGRPAPQHIVKEDTWKIRK